LYEAVVREVKEETGLQVVLDPLEGPKQTDHLHVTTIDYYADDCDGFWNYTVFPFVVKVNPDQEPVPGHEIERVEFRYWPSWNEKDINYLHKRMAIRVGEKFVNPKLRNAKTVLVNDDYDDILGYVPKQQLSKVTRKLEINVFLLGLLAVALFLSIVIARTTIDFSLWPVWMKLVASFLNAVIFVAGAFWISAVSFKEVVSVNE
jgi:hypothetical protein